jgi:methyltransferase-like protein/cyclopropane fatty-acyl-phospholipid synthase-like methyltransferase
MAPKTTSKVGKGAEIREEMMTAATELEETGAANAEPEVADEAPAEPAVEVAAETETETAAALPEQTGETGEPAYSYDLVPYTAHAFPQTHPDRLATMARLFGLASAPVDGCRVLELGCGLGYNLIPMALQMPGSEFVGVDLSKRQIEEGRKAAAAAGLANIRLEHANIGDVDVSWGKFDYIICHGVLSWVPAPIRQHILEISGRNLESNGVAYISYNTYPAWHMREMVRHMMLYHAQQFEQPQMRIGQSKALLKFMTDQLPKDNQPYALYLRQELALLDRQEDNYLFHDHLEDVNEPMYFHQFMGMAAAQGLQYLGEADFGGMLMHGVHSSEVRETLGRISPDVVHMEQYMDFLRNRSFRQTLLCHGEAKIRRRVDAEALESLLLLSNCQPMEPQIDHDPQKVCHFRTPRGVSVRVRRPATKEALVVLAEHSPRALSLSELFESVMERLPDRWKRSDAGTQRGLLLADLLSVYGLGAVDLRTWQVPCEAEVSERPRLSPVAAYQVRNGKTTVVDMQHRQTRIGPVARLLAPVLDGTHDRAALVEHAMTLARDGDLPLRDKEALLARPDEARRTVESVVDQALRNLAKSALLVS